MKPPPGHPQLKSHDHSVSSPGRTTMRRRAPVHSAVLDAAATAPAASDSGLPAVRLISETAHDLRSPLTSIGESIRLVHDGECGPINPMQREFLRSALDQSDCAHQMVEDLSRAERLSGGMPRAQRTAVTVDSIRDGINQAIRPWAEPRGVGIIWDLPTQPSLTLFADEIMIRRLLINLISNAIAVSARGGSVLVRARVDASLGLRFSVLDRGTGMSPQRLREIAEGYAGGEGGEGLGLAICRRMAAVHFSNLLLRSRANKSAASTETVSGTEAGFTVPVAVPGSIAMGYVRWRESVQGVGARSHRRSVGRSKTRIDAGASPHGDVPESTIEIGVAPLSPHRVDRFAAATVGLGETVNLETADRFDRLLQSQCSAFEFALRSSARRWAIVLDADEAGIADRVAAIEAATTTRIPAARMIWGGTREIPLDAYRGASQLSDWLVRHSLEPRSTTGTSIPDQVRPGTRPIEASAIASVRLDEEIHRLGSRFRKQSERLRRQVRRLRPSDSPA